MITAEVAFFGVLLVVFIGALAVYRSMGEW